MSEECSNSALHPRSIRTDDAHAHHRHYQNFKHSPENSAPDQAFNEGGARKNAEEQEDKDRGEDDRPVQEVNRQTYSVRGAHHACQAFCDIHVNAHHRRYKHHHQGHGDGSDQPSYYRTTKLWLHVPVPLRDMIHGNDKGYSRERSAAIRCDSPETNAIAPHSRSRLRSQPRSLKRDYGRNFASNRPAEAQALLQGQECPHGSAE